MSGLYNEKDLFLLGSIIKPRGLKGDLKVFCSSPDSLPKNNFEVLLSKKSGFIPFTVDKIKVEPQNILFHFLEINSLELALPLCGSDVFVEKSKLKILKKPFSFSDFKGYELVDEEEGPLGLFTMIFELPQQWIGVIYEKEKEILIPLNDHILRSVDKKNKRVYCRLPEGLLDIYRNP